MSLDINLYRLSKASKYDKVVASVKAYQVRHILIISSFCFCEMCNVHEYVSFIHQLNLLIIVVLIEVDS